VIFLIFMATNYIITFSINLFSNVILSFKAIFRFINPDGLRPSN
jgi:hypothetical protein